jgi:hypothetical protein
MITIINGHIQGPSALAVPDGSISFQLNIDATVIAAPGGLVPAALVVTFQLDANGNILPNSPATSAQIYSNAELQPQNSTGLGTFYYVTFYDANGARLNSRPMAWQFPEAANSTVDISGMTPLLTIGSNIIFYPVAFLSGVTSITFTGDGTIFSPTPGAPVTTTGTLTPTLLVQSPKTALMGPISGANAAPTFRTFALTDFPTPGANKQILMNLGGLVSVVPSASAIKNLFWDDTVDGLVALQQGIASAITYLVNANGNVGPGVACAGIVETASDATNPIQLFCQSASVIHQGTGSITKAAAYQSQISNNSTGTFSSVVGFWAPQPNLQTGSTSTNLIGVEIDDQSKSAISAVTPTNSWGIQIKPFSNSTNSFAIEVQGGKTQLTPNAIGDVALRVRKFSASQTAPAIEADVMLQFDGLTSGSAQLGVASVAGTPNRLNLPIATAGAANAVLVSDGGSPQQASWLAPTGTAGSAVLSVSPALTGTPTAPTQVPFDNTTTLATDAYVDRNAKGVEVAGFREDFLFGALAPVGTSITTAGLTFVADTGWFAEAILAAGTISSLVSSTFANPGTIQVTTAAVASGDGIVLFKTWGATGEPSLGALGSNAGWESHFVFKLAATTNIAIRVGFFSAGAAASDPPTSGIWMSYDTAAADTNFTFETRSAGTSTRTASSVAADTNYHHVRIRSTAAGTILFQIDGGGETSINTNVTSSALGVYLQLFTRTTATATATFDFVSYFAATGRT